MLTPPSHFGSQRLAFSLSQMQFSSVAQSCLNLCYPVDCSIPGLPVHHQLLKLAQTHGHEWRREWQTTVVFLPLDPHEEHDQALSLHACKRRFEGRRAELGKGVGSRSPLPHLTRIIRALYFLFLATCPGNITKHFHVFLLSGLASKV